VRVVTAGAHALLRAVPPPLASVLEMGSTSPGALLYDARRLYEARDARAAAELLDVLRGGDLPAAVAACLGAAAAELDPGKQEALMRAGGYGRAFLALHEGGDADVNGGGGGGGARGLGRRDIVAAARKLRVLNSPRDEGAALPPPPPHPAAPPPPARAGPGSAGFTGAHDADRRHGLQTVDAVDHDQFALADALLDFDAAAVAAADHDRALGRDVRREACAARAAGALSLTAGAALGACTALTLLTESGRAPVCTPVTSRSRMPSSA